MDPPTPLAELLDLVLPVHCAGCGATGLGCWCRRCGRAAGPPRWITGPRATPSGTPPTFAVGPYTGPLRAALLAYKERGRRDLVTPLAGLLADALLAGRPGWPRPAGRPWWLVSAPSRRRAARARGGDHMVALARGVARRLAGPLERVGGVVGVSAPLRMRPGARDSVGLDPAARAANLNNRIGLRPDELPPPGVCLLLLDDVITTGATLRECARVLAGQGRPVYAGVVLCDATGG